MTFESDTSLGSALNSLRSETPDGKLHQLYRHFNSDEELLYVGVSLSALARLCQHKAKSEWYSQITRIEIENWPTRNAAEEAEKILIAHFKPAHNITHNRVPESEPKNSQERYNRKRTRLCEFAVTEEDATEVEPALDRLVEIHGSKVAAITAAIYDLDEAHLSAAVSVAD